MLGEKSRTIFLGQQVRYPGSVCFDTLQGVPMEKRIELPVAEEMQMGMSLGLALEGFLPITIYPRIDFLLSAIDQLSNHLDVLEELTHGEYKAKVIIRTLIGSRSPLYPGIQHCRDHSHVFRTLLKNIPVLTPKTSQEVTQAYQDAMSYKGSTLVIEDANLYGVDFKEPRTPNPADNDDLNVMPTEDMRSARNDK